MGLSKKSDCQEGGEGGVTKNQYIEGNGLKGGGGGWTVCRFMTMHTMTMHQWTIVTQLTFTKPSHKKNLNLDEKVSSVNCQWKC